MDNFSHSWTGINWRSSAMLTTNSSRVRLAPIDNDMEYNGYVSISYCGNNHKLDRLRVNEKYMRSLFKKFPGNRAIILIREKGESVPVELFFELAEGKTFRLIEGDYLDSFAAEKQERPSSKYSDSTWHQNSLVYSGKDDHRSFLKLKKPSFDQGCSCSRSPTTVIFANWKSASKLDDRCYVSVERGQQYLARKVVPFNPRQLRNVAITKSGFIFEHLEESALHAFEIPASEKDRYCLMTLAAQILISDDKNNDFNWWKRRAGNSLLFLIKKEDSSELDSDRDDEEMTGGTHDQLGRRGSDWPDDCFAEDVKRGTEASSIPVLNLDDIDLSDDDWRTEANDQRAVVVSDPQNDSPGPVPEPIEPGQVLTAPRMTYESFDDLVHLLHCYVCSNVSSSPLRCPRFGHVMGGEKCIAKWFRSLESSGRKKTCPKCRAKVSCGETDDELKTLESTLRNLNLKNIQFCPN